MPQSVDQHFGIATASDTLTLSPTAISSNSSPVLQITPKSRHASSGFHYPAILSEYGVSEADWELFTSQFIAANAPSRNQLVVVSTLTLGFELFFLASGFGIFTLPFAALTAVALGNLPFYFIFKKRNLRRNIRNGKIPAWMAAHNDEFFGPKGLRLAFELPGAELPYTEVAPRRRVKTMALGEFKKPMKTRRAARRTRIVVVEAGEPRPEAGMLPVLLPLRTSKMHQMLKQGSVQWMVKRIKLYKAKTAEAQSERVRLMSLEQDGLNVEMEG